MQFLASAIVKCLRPTGDDDYVDRLNYYHTSLILLLCSLIVTAKQFVGRPLECWLPPTLSGPSMEEYIENYCWIQNTYYLPLYQHIPDEYSARAEKQIGYYQWVPFILVLEALMFSLPCIIWRLTNWQSGVNVQNFVQTAIEAAGMSTEARLVAVRMIAGNIQDVIGLHSHLIRFHPRGTLQSCLHRLFNRYSCSYITCMYLMVKCLYTINAVGQFFLLNSFLQSGEHRFYGWEILMDFINNRSWEDSGHFPRVTLCDFEVKTVGNLNRYTVQCVLVANFINDKIFLLLYIWIAIISLSTLGSLTFWVFNSLSYLQRFNFVAKFVHRDLPKRHRSVKAVLFDKFVTNHLQKDGVFVLRMISTHAGDIITMEVVKCLWQDFRDSQIDHIVEVENGFNSEKNPEDNFVTE